MNGAIGVGGVWNTGHRIFKNLNVELDATGYYQQAGEIWPFDSGYGLYARASADIYDFRVKRRIGPARISSLCLVARFFGAAR